MNCALHIHTHLSDGMHAPEEIISAYQRRGFACVAITDHQYMTRPDYYERLELLGRKFSGSVMVLPGIEHDYEPWNYHHLLEIRGVRETLRVLCHPRAYYLTPEQISARVAAAPFPIDAIEITHRGFYTAEYDVSSIALPKIATDDAHELYDLGRGWIETENFSDPDLLLRAIKAGEFTAKFA